MATETNQAGAPGGIRGIEVRSIDWIPDTERHGKVWHQGPLWFLGNFQYFTIPIGFVGPAFGLSLWWTILAGTLGILIGTVFMAFHAAQGPTFGLPQMIQSRAQFGFRGVVVALFAALFTYLAFNIADQVLLAEGLHGAFGWNAIEVDGNNFEQLLKAFAAFKAAKGKPTAVIAHTLKGKGVPFMELKSAWHGKAPNKEQLADALKVLY